MGAPLKSVTNLSAHLSKKQLADRVASEKALFTYKDCKYSPLHGLMTML